MASSHMDRNPSTRAPLRSSDAVLLDRLVQLRRAHQVLAYELGATQRRLLERERELRSLRTELHGT